jgi:adenylosuccinate synthase
VLKELVHVDSEQFINTQIRNGKKVLAEGAQGSLLDIDFGTYPFVTSSNTVTAGACTGLGIAPGKIGNVIGIFKAYCTRVGSGPFPTELEDATGEKIRAIGREFGATTGRPRRCGWLDLPALNYAIMINGVTELMMMKADVLSDFDTIKVCTHYILNGEKIDYLPFDIINEKIEPVYVELKGWKIDLTQLEHKEQLPKELTDYIAFIEKETQVPISIVSIGPDRKQTIFMNEVLVK